MSSKPIPNDKPLALTVSEVSRLLNLSRGSTYEAIRRGEIPHIRIGRRILISKKAFERFLNRYDEI